MGCIAVIPARFESTRFPGKPLATLQGRPLIAHVVERCLTMEALDGVLVATDDERIADAARAAGAEARMTPANLASGTDRVAYVAEGLSAEVILNVQGDEPLIDPASLDDALQEFCASENEYGTLRAPLTEARDLWDPHVVKVVIDAAGRALYFSRAPIPFPRDSWSGAPNEPGRPVLRFGEPPELAGGYWAHVGVYMYRRQALLRWARMPESLLERLEGLEQLRVLEAGGALQTYPVAESLPGVDTPADLDRVRERLAGG
jgi:3-deoxy-manno-octulosonate cytidylyltransferase (CMP-KDO synthetase)